MNYIVIALGNPGEKYASTRHNAGWIVLESIFFEAAFKQNDYAFADVAKTIIADNQVTLVKPNTFMNESGNSVRYFIEKENILPENMIVLYDDIDLALGKVKISFDRGSGGHNGIKSIEEHLGSREFIRIRIGISKTLEDGSIVKPNVLGNFESDELLVIKTIAKKIEEMIQIIITNGREAAMTKFNGGVA